MNDTPDIVVSGHLCLDLLPRMDHITPEMLISAGNLYEVGSMDVSTGGAVSNTGLALHRLGANVCLMARVGDDLIGRVILSFLNERDPSLSHRIRVQQGRNSAYTVVLSPLRRDRVFLTHTGLNATFGSDDIDYTLLEKAKIFHLGYPPLLPRLYANDGEELVKLFALAKQTGVITSLDMSLPDRSAPSGAANWRLIFERVLPYVDIFVPSVEEALFSLRSSDADEKGSKWHENMTIADLRHLADELFQMGNCAIVGFKLGEYGIYLRTSADSGARLGRLYADGAEVFSSLTPNIEIYHPAFQVEVVGTTGAGDAAYAALLMGLLRGLDLASCALWMCAVGACDVEAADATSSVQSWEATALRIDSGWALSPLKLPES